jgi:hypothetical protein
MDEHKAIMQQFVRLAGGWCWFVLKKKYYQVAVGDWFIMREKYCWLVADKPDEHDSFGSILVKQSFVAVHNVANLFPCKAIELRKYSDFFLRIEFPNALRD